MMRRLPVKLSLSSGKSNEVGDASISKRQVTGCWRRNA